MNIIKKQGKCIASIGAMSEIAKKVRIVVIRKVRNC